MSDRKGKRVLVVEDEFLIALHLEDVLTAMGHQVVGSASRLNEALDLARTGDIDFAVLDVNLAGTQSFPVAEVLRERGIPFVFATGYGVEGLVDGYRDQPTLQKPYERYELEQAIKSAFEVSRE